MPPKRLYIHSQSAGFLRRRNKTSRRPSDRSLGHGAALPPNLEAKGPPADGAALPCSITAQTCPVLWNTLSQSIRSCEESRLAPVGGGWGALSLFRWHLRWL